MTKDTKLSELVINKLTVAQYDAIEEKDPNQLYIVTDAMPPGVDLFDHKWADHILNDMSWLRADTFSWQSGDLYKSAYEHLVEDFNGTVSATETIGSHTITYYQAIDGHKIVLPDMEATVQAIYEETGVSWYYILDVVNKRFKLPRELPITDKSKGNGMTLGLTDGTDNYGAGSYSVNNVGIYASSTSYGANVGIDSGNLATFNPSKSVGITTDPTKSGIISHRENENGQQYLYFYIGNYSKSAIEQTAGVTTEVLNGKLDKSDMQVVSELPAEPVEGVYYFVKE